MKTRLILVILLIVLARPAISDWSEPQPEFVIGRLQVSNRDPFLYWPNYFPDNPPWHHDFPEGDEFLINLVHELTGVRVTSKSFEVVPLESNKVFKYPFVYLSEPGFLALNDKEIKNLGEYIRRGGFIMVDDFRGKGFLTGGPEELEILRYYLKKALPERELVRLNITHPIFHSFYDVDTLDMNAPYVILDEHGRPNPPQFWGMSDENGNLQVIANYNNDVGDFFKYLDMGDKPLADSSRAVRLGINYVIYAFTH